MKRLFVFDLDKTAVEARADALPSDRLVRAVGELQKVDGVYLACATGRTYPWARVVTDELKLKTPCIVSAGTQIVNPIDGSEVWSKRLSVESVAKSLEVMKRAGIDPRILTETDTPATAKRASELDQNPYLLLDVQDIEPSAVDELISNIKSETSVAIAKVDSPNTGFVNLHITNIEATKEHAVAELCRLLGVEKSNTYGIGDGHNDLHLFNSVGTKVAMGNAVAELKAEADIVIGSLADDGLAVYLESFLPIC
jgi:HAD superfamily hydrolase (TIGR01484 family)